MGRIPEFKRRNIQQFQDTNAIEQKLATGRQIDRTIMAGVGVYQQIQRANAEDWTAKNFAQYQSEAERIKTNYRQENQEDPEGTFVQLEERLSDLREGYLADSPNSYASTQFTRMSTAHMERERASNTLWEAKQITLNTQTTARKHAETQSMNAYRVADPSKIDVFITEDTPAMRNLKHYASPDVYNKTLTALKNNATMSAFEGMIDNGDLQGAQKLLDSKKFDDSLGVEGVTQIQKMINRSGEKRQRRIEDLDGYRNSNGWKFVEKTGLDRDLPVINDQVVASGQLDKVIEDRIDFIESTTKKFGINSATYPPLKPSELKTIQRFVDTAPPDQVVDFMQTIKKATYDNTSGERNVEMDVIKQIYNSGPSGRNSAILMDVADTSPEEARHIVIGNKILKDKNAMESSQYKSMEKNLQSYVGSNLEFITSVEGRQAATHAIKASLASKIANGSITSVSESDVKETFNNLFGEPVDYNGHKFLPPRVNNAYMKEEEVKDLMNGLTSEDFQSIFGDQPRYVDGTPLSKGDWEPESFRGIFGDNFYIAPSNSGKYQLMNDSGQVAIDSKGKPFEIDFEKIIKRKAKK